LLLSVIIPCKNEERFIQKCIDSLLNQNGSLLLEIIVVDNGSVDNTVDILKTYGSKIHLFESPNTHISEARNYGASKALGEWLAFIDADVEVDKHWLDNLRKFLAKKEEDNIIKERIVTGSTCLIPTNASWLEKIWFGQLQSRDLYDQVYINSGHLIINKKLFEKIGGFDTSFETGEDEKLCFDARKQGALILPEPVLKAIHHGYPKSLRSFFKRARWHGRSMKKYLSHPWQYRDLLLGFYNLIVIIVGLVFLLLLDHKLVVLGTIIILIILPVLLISIIRVGRNFASILPLTLLFLVYGMAKTFALFDIFFFPDRNKPSAEN
jgi:glycosyltransferase involved in cell wall biosynthesis